MFSKVLCSREEKGRQLLQPTVTITSIRDAIDHHLTKNVKSVRNFYLLIKTAFFYPSDLVNTKTTIVYPPQVW